MNGNGESTESLAQMSRDETPAARSIRFPVIVTLGAVVGWVVVYFLDVTRDYKLVASVCIAVVAVFLLWVWLTYRVTRKRTSRVAMLLCPVLGLAAALVSFQPIVDGDMDLLELRWRWSHPADAALRQELVSAEDVEWRTTDHDYPAYLGPNRNAKIENVALDTDWETRPPNLVWRTEVGAGWSGFVVVGDYAITQEQRGDFEMVLCRRVSDGEIVWTHRDEVRFAPHGWEKGSVGEIGPRATPLVHDGKVFTHGATGILNCIDARSGELSWSRDTIEENGGEVLTWGKSGSPIAVDNKVVVSVGAPNGKSLVAYDMKTGDVAWAAGNRKSSYATPVLTTLAGVRQIVCANENYVTSHDVKSGDVLWEHRWDGDSSANATCPNPIPVDASRLLLCKGYGIQSELLEVAKNESGDWETSVIWRKPVMRTKMTNAIVDGDYVFGLDGGILSCVELETGKRLWKQGRYGHGQVLLVGDVILITTELTGEVVLVAASPDKPKVLARLQVLNSSGKMWNYPALAGKYLIVRNAEEAACFELPIRTERSLAALPNAP